MTERKDAQIAKDITDMVNNMTYSSTEFVDEIMTSHRTLQQNTFRLFIDLLKEWELMYIDDMYDLRNEHTVKSASIMLETLRDANHGVDNTPHI